MKLTIGWLYPDLMSTYGDRGNIICLTKRCEWRGIEVEVVGISQESLVTDLNRCDLLFMGGAQDRQQEIAAGDLYQKKGPVLKKMIEDGVPGLFICGAYQFLGKYYQLPEKKIPGLGIFDVYTVHYSILKNVRQERLIGNIITKVQSSKFKVQSLLVGFENHGGRTYLGKDVEPLGKVIKGFGNNGEDKTEGCIYKNAIGTYLHGPILPKNPQVADWLLKTALEKKYQRSVELEKLDDSLEEKAHDFILKKMGTR